MDLVAVVQSLKHICGKIGSISCYLRQPPARLSRAFSHVTSFMTRELNYLSHCFVCPQTLYISSGDVPTSALTSQEPQCVHVVHSTWTH